LLGAIYFFPGLHKLLSSGLDWAMSGDLRFQMYWKWAQHGVIPGWRLDAHPALLRAGGLFVLAFELSFGVLVLFRRTRGAAAAAGLVFHLVAQLALGLLFASLWLCYVALVDWRPLFRRLRSSDDGRSRVPPAPTASSPRQLAPAAAVGAILLIGAVVQGARGQMRSYPFSCYPTFQWRAAPDMPDLMIVAADERGNAREVTHARDAAGRRTARQWAEIWSLAGVTGPIDAARLRAYYAALVRGPHPPAGRVTFFRVYRSVIPGEGGRLTGPPTPLLEIND
jgi:hypothetical protein